MTTMLLMAAGKSRRFGAGCKLQSLLKGKPLVRHAADAILQTGLPAIAVVSDPDVQALLPEFACILADGPKSHTLQAGLGAIDTDAALIVLADMPFVTAELLLQIVQAPHPSAATDGTRITPPACLPRSMFAQLMHLQGDEGAGKLLRTLSGLTRVEAASATLRDIDTPADLIAVAQ